ncbi:MAG: hypothetical protein ACRCWR_05445 [Saezia sp.]
MPTFFTAWRILFLSIFILMMQATHAQMPSEQIDLSRYSSQSYKSREIHGEVELRVIGQKEERVFLFVPAAPHLKNEAPIVFFHHGWQGMNPMNFGALIDHLVRSGHVVIYPVFQNAERTSPLALTHNAGQANRIALNLLAKEFGLSPKQGQTLYYGFSIGSAISVNLALAPEEYGLPPADAVIMIAPGDAFHLDLGQTYESIYRSLKDLPPTLPIVIMTGEEDDIGLPTARSLYAGLTQSPQKILYILPPSRQGSRKVAAGHGSPGAPDSRYNFSAEQQQFPTRLKGLPTYEKSASLNQLDFFGYWKIIDGLLDGLKKDGAFSDIVFGSGSAQQLSLGVWEDGTPLTPMKIENTPNP